MFDIVCLGDNCVDIYEKPGKMQIPGGNAVNVSVYAQRMDLNVCYYGFFGNDEWGKFLKEKISEQGVNVDLCRNLNGTSGFTKVELQNNDRIFPSYDPGVQKDFYLVDSLDNVLSTSKINFYSGFTSWESGKDTDNFMYKKMNLKVLQQLKNYSNLVALDFSEIYTKSYIKCLAPFIDIAFFSFHHEDCGKPMDLIEQIAGYFNEDAVLVLTMGEKGSLSYHNKAVFNQEAVKTNVVDTLGCGDAFIGSFLAEYIKTGGDIQKCLLKGALAASITIRKFGAW